LIIDPIRAIILAVGILSPLLSLALEERPKNISRPTQDTYCRSRGTFLERGIASWYGPNFHGKTMANGEPYDMYAYTVAHKTLPKQTVICVTNPENGKSVRAVVTDRGPYKGERIIDLSKRVAEEIGISLGLVEIRVLSTPRGIPRQR
jgi:rare lipoprotein A